MVWGLLILIALLIVGGWRFSSMALYPNAAPPEERRETELERGRFKIADFERWEKESVLLTSPDGYQLFGLYFPLAHAEKTILIVHGIACNHYCSVKYADMFRQLGFNLLLVDLRHHGYSAGEFTSFGYYEKYDLQAWVDWSLARCQQDHPHTDCIIGTHGESLGGATVLQHAAIDSRLSFVIADCPYAAVADELAYRLKVEYRLPRFPLVPIASAITKLRAGFAFEDAAPIHTIAQVKIPVLFIHGTEDAYIPPEASLALYAAKPEPKTLYLVSGADHAAAMVNAPEAYIQAVKTFLVDAGIEVVRPLETDSSIPLKRK